MHVAGIGITGSSGWFIGAAALSALAAAGGLGAGRGPAWLVRLVLVCALALLGAWAWLMHHPEAAVRLISPRILGRIEGVGGAPLFMVIIGVAWARCHLARQRTVVLTAVIVGMLYFLQGGWWMIQRPPTLGRAAVLDDGEVLQSENYSCVAAASATALKRVGIAATESEMAWLTQTRRGTGSTMVRALAGLRYRLHQTAYRAELLGLTPAQLRAMPTPAMTALQFEPTRRHMVTILRVSPAGVVVADPINGRLFMDPTEFQNAYRGQVIVIYERNESTPHGNG